MVKSIADYKKLIVRTLKKEGVYKSGLTFQIYALASALNTLDKVNRDIEGLECTTVQEVTRYGHKIAQHPAFKIQRDAQASITKQLKVLGLSTEALMADDEHDPLLEVTKRVQAAGGKERKVIKPTKA